MDQLPDQLATKIPESKSAGRNLPRIQDNYTINRLGLGSGVYECRCENLITIIIHMKSSKLPYLHTYSLQALLLPISLCCRTYEICQHPIELHHSTAGDV